jgi:hypothetical protein
MGIFSTESVSMDNELLNPDELLENYIYDELSRLPDERRKEVLESEEMKALEEARIISRKTLVRLSRQDDYARRVKMAALQLAKDNNDVLFDKLAKNRIKERELLDKIVTKYGTKASKVAKIGQKAYLKKKLPLAFFRK